jgi:hypothetical protein
MPVADITENIMQAKDIRGRSQKYPAGVAYKKLRQLDDTLQRERRKRHVMSKSEFRIRLLRRLQYVRLDKGSGDVFSIEASASQERT